MINIYFMACDVCDILVLLHLTLEVIAKTYYIFQHMPLNYRCTLLLQLHFNSFSDANLIPIELILRIMEKIVLSPIWCDFTLQGQDEYQGRS